MSETFDSDVFSLSPIAMWIEDFSGVKALFDVLRSQGATDIRTFLREDTARVTECSSQIRLLNVNARTLELFEATDLDHLRNNLHEVFRDDMLETHVNELADLFDGKQAFSSTTVNYTLSGQRLDIQL